MATSSTAYGYTTNGVTFSFTAHIDGKYYVDIDEDTPFGHRIDYSYTVTSAFFGINSVYIIGFVIAIGIGAELFVIFTKHRPK